MRWFKPEPAYAAERVVVRFALLPRRLDDGFVVWLESYRERQTWVYGLFGGPCWCPYRTERLP